MLKELRNGDFAHQIATEAEVAAFTHEAWRMVDEYGWKDRTVAPWGHAEPVTKTLKYIADFHRCEFTSKQMLITLANGLAKIMNAWEKVEIEGVTVRIINTGRIIKVSSGEAAFLAEEGLVEILKP